MSKHEFIDEAARSFFNKNGYLTIPHAVPQPLLYDVIQAIWTHLRVKGDHPDDWYRLDPTHKPNGSSPPITRGGGVRFSSHHPALWATRQHPKIHQIFSELLGTEKLWASFDRANMKPPVHPDHPEWDSDGLNVHWDLDTENIEPVPLTVQGVLYLTDTDETQGGFRCVPGFHNQFAEWKRSLPDSASAKQPPFEKGDLTPIPGKAGDLLIWHRLTPHANGRNESDKPRLAQYITMFPAKEHNAALRQERIDSWRTDTPIRSTMAQEFDIDMPITGTHDWDTQNTPTELSGLGRKLVGIDTWT